MNTNKIRTYARHNFATLPQIAKLSKEEKTAIDVVSSVLPFKLNNYVVEHLIDWDNIPDDPIFRLTFPHREMLEPDDFQRLAELLSQDSPPALIQQEVARIRAKLNPHPAGQLTHNVPSLNGERLSGLQHKYRQTVLFFPSQGQTCHAYCTFCFRWPQFVGIKELKFQSRQVDTLVSYLKAHPEVSDVLLTGGDPMIMSARLLTEYIEPLLQLEQLSSLRIGSKSLSYWPQRYLSDADSDDVLRLFEKVRAAGKNLAFMAHFNHPRELSTSLARRAIERIRSSGATIRCQSPLVRHINDRAEIWSEMWRTQVQLGCIPYYMFVERDTGASHYFRVPLGEAFQIFRTAYRQVSGLARTVRGPSMSANPGKVCVDGILEVGGSKKFVLRFLQARNPEWTGRPFLAEFDPNASWLDQLRPPAGEGEFFYETELRQMANSA